jgi:extradiol dioxygenase family protein
LFGPACFDSCMFSLDSLGHINVVVTDLEEATNFYRTLFGEASSKPSRISKILDLHGQPVFWRSRNP